MKQIGDVIDWIAVNGPVQGVIEKIEVDIKYWVRLKNGKYTIVTERELKK